MIRTTLLWMFVAFVSVYAWRDWYKAVCALIVMMAVIQHPDMPKTLLGIQGMNPWNIALVSTVAAWWSSRSREQLSWDMPRHLTVFLCLYMGVALIAFARMIIDREALHETVVYLVSEHLINVFKWVVPALLLFDGCRQRRQFTLAVLSIGALYLLLAVQVIKWVPLTYAMSGESLEARSHKVISTEIGYHRVNMSMMLAGASWAIFVAGVLAKRRLTRVSICFASLAVLLGQSLTAGRAGYATWGLVGLILCLIRWKRYLFVGPLIAFAIVTFVPGVSQRMTEGFSEDTRDTNLRLENVAPQSVEFDDDGADPDLYTVTSGRVIAWPFVIDKIEEAPIFGYGKQAMRRTGLAGFLMDEFGEGFPHPHNAYLELLLDTGVVGFLVIVPFYLLIVYYSLSLFRDSRNPAFIAIGGICASLTVALLVAAMGSQTFYPREGAVGMWASIGLMLRVRVQRERAGESMQKSSVRPRNSFTRHARPQYRTPSSPAARVRMPHRPQQDSVANDFESLLWRNVA